MTAAPGPVVSVLVPCWNAEVSIERALHSVLELRDVPLECVVVDDASTDGTLERVRAVAASDPRVVVIALAENAGVSNARNRGLDVVRGTWLTLLDADDRFLPGGLGTLATAALGSDALAVIGQQIWWDGIRRWRTARYDVADIREPGRKSLAANPGLLNYVSPHAKLLHRDAWRGLEFSGRVLGDQPWIIRALLRAGDRIDVMGETVYEWYRPAPTIPSTSITATTRASVARGVEAVAVAGEALVSVRAEAARLLNAQDRAVIEQAYAVRLVRTDVAAHLATAMAREDPDIGLLFDAISGFIPALPSDEEATARALTRSIIVPSLRGWDRIGEAGRSGFWRMFEAAVRAQPGLPDQAGGRRVRLGLRMAAAGSSRLLRAAAVALVAGDDARRKRTSSVDAEPDEPGELSE